MFGWVMCGWVGFGLVRKLNQFIRSGEYGSGDVWRALVLSGGLRKGKET